MKSTNISSLWFAVAVLFSLGCASTTTRQEQAAQPTVDADHGSVLERMLNDRRTWVDPVQMW
jgi:hypothetical protein